MNEDAGLGAARIVEKTDAPPDGASQFHEVLQTLRAENYRHRTALAMRLKPVLNAYVRTLPQQTANDYRAIGLTIRPYFGCEMSEDRAAWLLERDGGCEWDAAFLFTT
jgi:hypothetical protein